MFQDKLVLSTKVDIAGYDCGALERYSEIESAPSHLMDAMHLIKSSYSLSHSSQTSFSAVFQRGLFSSFSAENALSGEENATNRFVSFPLRFLPIPPRHLFLRAANSAALPSVHQQTDPHPAGPCPGPSA
jgi:hypothetical protein